MSPKESELTRCNEIPWRRPVTQLPREPRLADALERPVAEPVDASRVGGALVTSRPLVAGPAPALVRLGAEARYPVTSLRKNKMSKYYVRQRGNFIFRRVCAPHFWADGLLAEVALKPLLTDAFHGPLAEAVLALGQRDADVAVLPSPARMATAREMKK